MVVCNRGERLDGHSFAAPTHTLAQVQKMKGKGWASLINSTPNGGNIMSKINQVERIRYSGGLLGLLFGSSKGKLNDKVTQMNESGWHLHFIHGDNPNLLIWILRMLILIVTLGLWTIGSSELLVFEKDDG